MKYARFEDLPAWKAAMELGRRVYAVTRNRFFSQPGDLRDQLRRAALSVSNNIAEGFERGSTAELLAFLYIARGSAGEVRSMLHFTAGLLEDSGAGEKNGISDLKAERADLKSERADLKSEISDLKFEIADLKSEMADLKALAESCSRQIRAWADSLQNSAIKGQRHLNEQTRQAYASQSRAEKFRSKIERDFHEAHPELFPENGKEE
jgi:four helix bundle protein